MFNHSKQLIQDLTERISSVLVNFFDSHDEVFGSITLGDIVEDIMYQEFNLPDSSSLKQSADKALKRYQNTKSRWFQSYKNNRETYPDITDKYCIFNTLYKQYKMLTPEQWKILYTHAKLDDVVADYELKVTEWRDTRKSLLIACPLIDYKPKRSVYAAFQLDLTRDIYNLIKKEYGGNLNSFFKAYPQELVDKPLFSPTKNILSLTDYADKGIDDFLPGSGNSILRTTINNFDADMIFRTFNDTDLTILSTIIANVDTNFYISRTVNLYLSDIVHSVYNTNSKMSAKSYENVSHRCTELGSRQFQHFSEKNIPGVSISFFSHVIVDPPSISSDRRRVEVVFGDFLYDAIVHQKLVRVTSKNYNSLALPLSRILYYLIQSERVNAGITHRHTGKLPIKNYDYGYFANAVRFKLNRKKDNIKQLNESFDDFVEKKIAIKSYTSFPDGTWEIHFFPLSDAEYSDLRFEKMNPNDLSITSE